MGKKYVQVRMPIDVHNNFKKKQERMQNFIAKCGFNHHQIPLTRVLRYISENEVEIPDNYLLAKEKKRKGGKHE